jgi:hypothetical protein
MIRRGQNHLHVTCFTELMRFWNACDEIPPALPEFCNPGTGLDWAPFPDASQTDNWQTRLFSGEL